VNQRLEENRKRMSLAAAGGKVGKILLATYRTVRNHKLSGFTVEELKARWAYKVLGILGVEVTIKGTASRERPTIFVGNHISYLDIPVLMSQAPQANFVAKAELASWPLFGHGMRESETIFVKRESVESRGQVRETLLAAVRAGKSVAVFPSGTTSLREDIGWRPGAFRLAEDSGVPLQAFRLRFTPIRDVAYIDDDSFLPHLMNLCRLKAIHAEIEFAPPETVTDWKASLARWHAWSREGL
jgi:1-acyl-sn-glycerol-3-phosphate acyltransferase